MIVVLSANIVENSLWGLRVLKESSLIVRKLAKKKIPSCFKRFRNAFLESVMLKCLKYEAPTLRSWTSCSGATSKKECMDPLQPQGAFP